jgi:hypothetical protein
MAGRDQANDMLEDKTHEYKLEYFFFTYNLNFCLNAVNS